MLRRNGGVVEGNGVRFQSVAEVYEVFKRDRPTEWVMTEDEYLDLCRLAVVREPIIPARVRRGRPDDPIYRPDEYYEELWLDRLRSGTALLLGLPIVLRVA